MRRGSEDREHEQSAGSRISDTVRNAFRRDQQITRCHRQLVAFQKEQAFAFDHLVDLILPGMCMKSVFLAWLERVEPDQ